MFIKLWMHQEVITIAPDTPLGEAAEILNQNNVRHLPVLEDEKLVGIITKNDISKALPSAMDSSLSPEESIIATQAQASSVMAVNPVTVGPMDPLENVALLMRRFKIGAVPVVKDEKLVGIITESDILQAFTEILGTGDKGLRIELQIKNSSSAIYKVMDICRQFEMELTAVSVYKNFSQDHQLLTIRVNGEETEDMIDALWSSGAKINRVLSEDDMEKKEEE